MVDSFRGGNLPQWKEYSRRPTEVNGVESAREERPETGKRRLSGRIGARGLRVVQDSADTSRLVGDSEANVIRGQVPNDAPVGWLTPAQEDSDS